MVDHPPQNPPGSPPGRSQGQGTPFRLVLTEKPSVARDLAAALGSFGRRDGYLEGHLNGQLTRIGWCLGHLVELADPADYERAWKRWRQEHLPMLPEPFRLRPIERRVDHWRVVQGLLSDPALTDVVNACDAGREGELIFAYSYQLAGCRAPVQRLWISSLTPAAIQAGFQRLRPGADLQPLEAAARCRSEADWLVGLNVTRAMTLRNQRAGGGAHLTVGRVQTPTLALIVDREREIRDFVPRTFWKVVVTFRSPRLAEAPGADEDAQWKATWRRRDAPVSDGRQKPPKGERKQGDDDDPANRIDDEAVAKALLERVRTAGAGEVVRARRKERREPPPLLYDLTALQREANRRFGFSAQHTLDLAQKLYEQHKLLTYPRTDSRHLTVDQAAHIPGVLHAVSFGPYQAHAQQVLAGWPPAPLPTRVFDDSEVGDHHAIIPTTGDPQRCQLSIDEKRIYDLVVRRLLGAFFADAVFASVLIETDVPTAEGPERFVARGRTRLQPGWQAVDPPHSKRKELLLPAVETGDAADVVDGQTKEGTTKPPRRYTEATLLAAMERAGEALDERELRRAMKDRGLGTPATRAAVIEKLVGSKRAYIARDGKYLLPTSRGEALIDALPGGVPEALRSARLTGEWESRLAAIAARRESRPDFMRDIRKLTAALIEAIRDAPVSEAIGDAGDRPGGGPPPTGDPVAPCPRCQEPVVPDRLGWRCTGAACDLRIWKTVAHRELSPRMAKQLLTRGKTTPVKGFKSKAGKTFSAGLELTDEGKVSFYFPEAEPLGDCPVCGQPVRRRGKVYACDAGRECPFVVFVTMSEREIPEEAVTALLERGESGYLDGFVTRDGARYGGVLRWSEGMRYPDIVHVDPRTLAGPAAPCQRCGEGGVRFHHKRWRCDACDFTLPAEVMDRELTRDDVAALLDKGRTPRLHGFRQKGGAYCKAALTLEGDKLRVDFVKRPGDAPAPLPADAHPPAFGERTDCPLCVVSGSPEPGYVITGKQAWGCSRWRDGCRLQLPFVVAGRRWADDEIQRACGKHKATRYLKGFLDDDGKPRQRTWRLVIDGDAVHGWTLEERGRTKS